MLYFHLMVKFFLWSFDGFDLSNSQERYEMPSESSKFAHVLLRNLQYAES